MYLFAAIDLIVAILALVLSGSWLHLYALGTIEGPLTVVFLIVVLAWLHKELG